MDKEYPLVMCRTNGNRHDVVRGPSELKAPVHCHVLHAHKPRPFSDGFSDSINFKSNVAPCVIRLLSSCSPTHISRNIAKIVVNSFYGMVSAWAGSDIFKKCIKIIPLRRKFYPPSYVVFRLFGLSVSTSTSRRSPCSIFSGYARAFCRAMFERSVYFRAGIGNISSSINHNNSMVVCLANAVPHQRAAFAIMKLSYATKGFKWIPST